MIERIRLPSFDLGETTPFSVASSTTPGKNAFDSRLTSKKKDNAFEQGVSGKPTTRKWSMKPSQLTQKIYSTEDLEND